MRTINLERAVEAVRHEARPLTGSAADYDGLLNVVGDARFVLIGEASHGTHEFYRERARITRRLIAEHGFSAVAVEADWPDAYRVNRYVRGLSDDSAEAALDDFRRFPRWMWRNADALEFIAWLREYNDSTRDPRARAGFYGLDLYSLFTSIEAVLAYLDGVDAEAAARARARYSCFEHFEQDSQAYGHAAALDPDEGCEPAVVAQLVELRRQAARYAGGGRDDGSDAFFAAEQNARLVQNAEEYYRAMFRGRPSSWNLRDRHMTDTLDALAAHLDRDRPGARIVVWEHNSHLGDARATEMGRRGELNVGQLVRERHPGRTALVGLTTWGGTVTAARDWDTPAGRLRVRPALAGSCEALFHEAGVPAFMLDLRRATDAVRHLAEPRLQRAIGVIYRPETERWSHYFETVLPHQFDVVMHFDETEALVPLELTAAWQRGEPADTWPTGL